jgi:flagellar biosynthesis GTPase FlhF
VGDGSGLDDQQSEEATVLVEDVDSDDSEETARHSAAHGSHAAGGNDDIERLVSANQNKGGTPSASTVTATAEKERAEKERAEKELAEKERAEKELAAKLADEAEQLRVFEEVCRHEKAQEEWANGRLRYAQHGLGKPGQKGFHSRVDYWYKMLEPPPFSAAKDQVWGRHAYRELLTWRTQMDLIDTFFGEAVMARRRKPLDVMLKRMECKTSSAPVAYNSFLYWKETVGLAIMQDIEHKFQQMATGKSRIQLAVERAEAEYPPEQVRVQQYRKEYA